MKKQSLLRRAGRRLVAPVLAPLREAARRQAIATVNSRFLREVGDLSTARLLVQSQRFRKALPAMPSDGPVGDRILIFAPHQDDETLGAGGMLLHALSRGKTVKTVYVTDGVGNPAKIDDPDDYRRIRRAEAESVWREMGGEVPAFLDLPCRQIPLTVESARLLGEAVQAFRPDCVMLPFLLEAPVDHRAVNHLFAQAYSDLSLSPRIEVWAYQVTSMICPTTIVDITDVVERKDAVNRMWAPQIRYFDYAHMARGLAAYNSVHLPKGDGAMRFAEAFFVAPVEEYIGLCKQMLRSDVGCNVDDCHE